MQISQKSRKFTILVNKEKEGGYSGKCLELPGAISQGETLKELKTNMADAINLVLEYIQDKAKKEKNKIIEITTWAYEIMIFVRFWRYYINMDLLYKDKAVAMFNLHMLMVDMWLSQDITQSK